MTADVPTTRAISDEAVKRALRGHMWEASDEALCVCGWLPDNYLTIDGDRKYVRDDLANAEEGDDPDPWEPIVDAFIAHQAEALSALPHLAQPSDEAVALADRIAAVVVPEVAHESRDQRAYDYWRGYRAARDECVEVVRTALAQSSGRGADHALRLHPLSVRDQVVGSNAGGSASCVCGEWFVTKLDNPAGRAATDDAFIRHLAMAGVIQQTGVIR